MGSVLYVYHFIEVPGQSMQQHEETGIDHSVRILESALGHALRREGDTEELQVYTSLGLLHNQHGKLKLSSGYLQKAVEITEKQSPDDSAFTLCNNNLAMVQLRM